MEILKRVLDEMPERFTSNRFIEVAKKHGIPTNWVPNGIIVKFLLKNAKRIGSRRLYEKKQRNILSAPSLTIDQIWDESNAVSFLKARGYKIMKPTTEWREI